MEALSGSFKPPRSLIFDKNIHKNFEIFLRSLDIYMSATGLNGKDEKTKIAIFLNLAGEEAQIKFQTFDLSEQKRQKYEEVVNAFQEYCRPLRNETFDRYKFFTRIQQEGESFDNFITDIKILASTCNFGNLEKSLLRDKIVSGILDLSIQERLLQQSRLTLEKAEEICRGSEISKRQVKELKNHKEVDLIQRKTRSDRPKSAQVSNKLINNNVNKNNYDCLKYGRNHGPKNCPAFGKLCQFCSKPNHFSVGCKYKTNSRKFNQPSKSGYTPQFKKRVHEVNDSSNNHNNDTSDEDSPFIDSIEISIDNVEENKNGSKAVWRVPVIINSQTVNFKLDTGADCNCMSISTYEKLGLKRGNVIDTGVSIITYSNVKVKCLGYAVVQCIVKGARYNVKIYIVETKNIPILGLNACIKMNLIKRIETLQSFSDKDSFINNNLELFEGTGKIPFQYKIMLKQKAEPHVSGCRRIPETVKNKLKDTLDDLVKRDIIMKVEEPTEWVNNIVIVEKPNGSLRICLDPLHLNKNIIPDQFPIPTLEDLAVKLKDKSIFTVIDLKEGFYQIPLEKESMKYTCFLTPFGKFCFRRLPFGLKVSPEVFQRTIEKIFGDLKVGIYFDDLIIGGATVEEHDSVLFEVLKRAKKYGIKFNRNKVQFKVHEVKYLGQIFSSTGISPDSNYIQAVLNIQTPNDKKQLLRIIGMLNYLTKYIPNLSNFLSPLRELIKKNMPFVWNDNHTKILNDIKKYITQMPQLQIFDPNHQIVVQTDASKNGLGGCLLQRGKPVAFCSRAMTEAETRYPQIDKELLAICFSLEKFHNFVYGRKILVNTDHRPLVSICKKDFYKVSGRLQRLKLRLLKYNFDVEYLPGKYMYIADLLSRSFLKENTDNKSQVDTNFIVHSVDIELSISDVTLTRLRNATRNDSTLKQIITFCNNSWPLKSQLPINSELLTFFKIQDSLHSRGGLLFLDHKLVVPNSLRYAMLEKLHTAHLGIEKTKRRARKIFYWPNMSTDIQKFISKCSVCLKYSRNNVKEPMIPHDRPNLPFNKIASDIFTYGGSDYLVVVDYFSNWIEMNPLKYKSALEVIKHFKRIFSTFGIPKEVIADNVPYNSLEFKKFSKQWDFALVTSSPRYPKSNGLAERAVGICKDMLKKSSESDTDIHLALLDYRTTPLSGLNLSPTELLNNRLLRTTLPVTSNILSENPKVDKKKIFNHRHRNCKNYNSSAKTRSEFKIGESIIFKKEQCRYWQQGEIVEKSTTPRSYLVKDEFGKIFRRNSSFIKTCPNPTLPLSSEVENDIIEPSPNENSFCKSNEYSTSESNENTPHSDSNVTNGNGMTGSNQSVNKQFSSVTDKGSVVTRYGRVVNKPERYTDQL